VLDARQIEKKRLARIRDEPNAAAMPVEKGERHGIDRFLLRPMSARMNGNCPPHSNFTTGTQSTQRERVSLRAQRSNLGRFAKLSGIASSLRSSQ
jgi:hypothetical protein